MYRRYAQEGVTFEVEVIRDESNVASINVRGYDVDGKPVTAQAVMLPHEREPET